MDLKIKYCGCCSLEDYELLNASKADIIGFVFADSKRMVNPDEVASWVRKIGKNKRLAGVFQDASLKAILETVTLLDLEIIQCHGTETPEFMTEIKNRTNKEVYKAIPFQENTVEVMSHYQNIVDGFIVDSRSGDQFGGTGKSFCWANVPNLLKRARQLEIPCFIAGGIQSSNVTELLKHKPDGIDLSGGIEEEGKKNRMKITELERVIAMSEKNVPDMFGRYGRFGGKYVPETIMFALEDLEEAFDEAIRDEDFQRLFQQELNLYSGRPTPLTFAKRLSETIGGASIYLKREDLNHTGAHKINNAIGQALLAVRMGKKKIIAETGAGQHGVAAATVAAKYGLSCKVYMGKEDIKRQQLNVFRMELLGAEVVEVTSGSQTLKDATNEAIREWVAAVEDTFYLIGSAVGPHPYPKIVKEFQKVIGYEAIEQFRAVRNDTLPEAVIACVGGGSNAIGMFSPFIKEDVALYGVEAGGKGVDTTLHAATLSKGKDGVIHGSLTKLLQSEDGQITEPYSISAGLDYPGIGPEHAYMHETKRVKYEAVTDVEALDALKLLCEKEGILPALESAHALAYSIKLSRQMSKNAAIIVCLSGRGDKDVHTLLKKENEVLAR